MVQATVEKDRKKRDPGAGAARTGRKITSRKKPETMRFQRLPQKSPSDVAAIGQSQSFSTAKPIARKTNAAKSSLAIRDRKQRPESAIQKRTAHGVPAGSTRGTSQSKTAPVTAFLTMPANVGIGAPGAVCVPTRNCLGCIPYQTQ